MLTAAALALLSAPQTAGAEARLLAAFDTHCAILDDIEQIDRRIVAAGWPQFTPAEDGELSRLVAAIKGPDARFRVDTRTYRSAADPGVVVLVSEMHAPNGTGSIECKAMDEQAAKPDLQRLRDWAGRAPSKTKGESGALVWAWRPGLKPDQTFTAVTYVPANSKPKFPGVGLSASTVKFLP